MQFVVAAPEFAGLETRQRADEMLMRPVCGVPLLIRTLATAARAGASEILLVWPEGVPEFLARQCMRSDLLRNKAKIRLILVKSFDPGADSSWENIQDDLE